MSDDIERELREGTPDTPQRKATIRRADVLYAKYGTMKKKKHCWHSGRSWTNGIGPTHTEYTCCHCGTTTTRCLNEVRSSDHGPFVRVTEIQHSESPVWHEECRR